MTKSSLLAAMMVVASVGVARAGGQAGSIGVGVEHSLDAETEGLSMNYDAGKFHVGGFLGLTDPSGPSNDTFDLGARFYYHVHSTAMADFGLGGELTLASLPPAPALPMADRQTHVYLAPGFQIRAFIASNVALSFTGGIVIGAADASGLALGGQLVAAAGIHYYFF